MEAKCYRAMRRAQRKCRTNTSREYLRRSGRFGDSHPIENVRAGRTQKSPEEKSPGLCDPNRIQTYNLLIRSQMLYSIELWDQFRSNDLYFDSAYFVAPSSLRITIFFSLILAFFPESALR